jgi:all-trans-retinol dehydrogenase (NAD+)
MTEPFAFSGAHAVITGAGSGIGRLMALGLARRGASQVAVWDLNLPSAQAVVKEIKDLGVDASAYKVDVSSKTSVDEAAHKTLETLSRVDLLINNAGIVSGKKFLDLSEKDITQTYGVNTLALYWTTQAFLPGMLTRDHGRVVTIASAAGLAGSATLTDYSGSKYAAVGFMESLRAELRDASSAVSTLTVCPFYINTGMFDGVKSGSPLLKIQPAEPSANKILDTIASTKQELLLPGMVYSVRFFRLLPVRVFDWLADAFGINKAMKTFRGRKP